MGQTTTMIFLLATLLMAASGQGQPTLPAPSPMVNQAMNCTAGLAVCLPVITTGGPPSKVCCTAVETTMKLHLSCICSSIKSLMLFAPVNATAFSALLSQGCGLALDPNLCAETAAETPLPKTTAPIPGPPKADKDAASKLAGTSLVGIVLITVAAMFN